MQYVLLIYRGTTPVAKTPAWMALLESEQQALYQESAAGYAAITQTAA